MLLRNLINNPSQKFKDLNIRGLALNSREVKKGFIFFALKGNLLNGENFINHAIKNGAVAIFCSKNCKVKSKKVLIVKTNSIKKHLNEITAKFYRKKPKNIIAVTGTNGKTSVADFFCQILHLNNVRAASIGTLGIKFGKKFLKSSLTSPDIISLHKNLEKIKNKKIDNVIIEASSHGLHQGRLDGTSLKAGIFTNLSQDHLDYHKSMKSYLAAKLLLFNKLLKKGSSVITDHSIKEYSTLTKISKKNNLKLITIRQQIEKIKKIPITLIGSFQKRNLAMAVLAAYLCGLKYSKIYKILKKIKDVNGRLQLIKRYPNNIKVYIDYAHTPDALNEVLKSIKENQQNNISLVFGCGGNRDQKKRPLMAQVAKRFCNKIYVTDDNPRMENPAKIRKAITLHLKGCKFFNIGNRSHAIKKAILNAEPNEVILIAGKGHEEYQDYGKKILSISDKKIIKSIKISKTTLQIKKKNYYFNSKILNKVLNKKRYYPFSGVSIDSRDVKKDNLFVAIKGKNNDGHKYIAKALKKGASYIISSKKIKKYQRRIIKVKDSSIFLNKFSEVKRNNTRAEIIAITGSVGKTSLKNILSNLLKNYGNSYASPRSFNNHFGVPLSLSNLSFNDRFGVFEIGMSKSGEIKRLSKKVKPNLAIITNIGEAHIENFDNIKGIAKAKSEIINEIQDGGTLIINRDDKFYNYLSNKAKKNKINIISFGKSKKSDVCLKRINNDNKRKKIIISFEKKNLEIPFNDINVYNVLASLAVIKALKLDVNKIISKFRNLTPSEGRGKFHKIRRYKKKFTLIDESYNASPFSVKNAILKLSKINSRNSKKYLFLGDMLELGKKSAVYHKQLSRLINSSDIDKVFVKGEKSLFTYKNLKENKRGNIFQCDQDVDLILENIIANNDYLMIKGSNATGLKNISNAMIKGF